MSGCQTPHLRKPPEFDHYERMDEAREVMDTDLVKTEHEIYEEPIWDRHPPIWKR